MANRTALVTGTVRAATIVRVNSLRERPHGHLVLVATPIGNLDDLSPRAVQTLRSADLIACEDTRRTGKLLHHAGIEGQMLAVHDHNEVERARGVVQRIRDGQTVALVSDAGTPGISDPGYALVKAVADAGLTVTAVPGPAAVIHALVISGLPTDRFAFEGFLPRKSGPRRARLEAVAADDRTLVFYVAPHRAAADLQAMAEAFGADRPAAVTRELTKLYEEVQRGTLAELAEAAEATPPRGEVTVVVGPAPAVVEAWTDEALSARLAELAAAGNSTRDAVKQVVAETGLPKRRIYDLAT